MPSPPPPNGSRPSSCRPRYHPLSPRAREVHRGQVTPGSGTAVPPSPRPLCGSHTPLDPLTRLSVGFPPGNTFEQEVVTRVGGRDRNRCTHPGPYWSTSPRVRRNVSGTAPPLDVVGRTVPGPVFGFVTEEDSYRYPLSGKGNPSEPVGDLKSESYTTVTGVGSREGTVPTVTLPWTRPPYVWGDGGETD